MLIKALTAIDASWSQFITIETNKDYFKVLNTFITQDYTNAIVFPPVNDVFNALKTPLTSVSVVVLGQDPYHNINQAHGLSFSVNDGIKIPPSLRNIFKELQQDIPNYIPPNTGNLRNWSQQGVMLLNATLTVRAHEAGSHQKKGWECFTDALIHYIANNGSNTVFMLWGAYAQSKQVLINTHNNLVLCAPHPSPLSAHKGWFGCKHFSAANNYLNTHNKKTIVW
jgi:uracil-DNA glycosylase